MNVPANLKYTNSDEWVSIEGKVATLGVTDYAQEQLSDVCVCGDHGRKR